MSYTGNILRKDPFYGTEWCSYNLTFEDQSSDWHFWKIFRQATQSGDILSCRWGQIHTPGWQSLHTKSCEQTGLQLHVIWARFNALHFGPGLHKGLGKQACCSWRETCKHWWLTSETRHRISCDSAKILAKKNRRSQHKWLEACMVASEQHSTGNRENEKNLPDV